jgi:hypothetical protein
MAVSARSPALWVTAFWLAAAGAAAQPRPGQDEPKGMEALGWDIFGFTTPSDVGSPGERSIAFEMTSGLGRRGGLYWSPIFSGELSYTIARNLSVSLSSFVTEHRIRSVPDLDDRAQVHFDGLSGEISYRFLERSQANPFAATLSVEPRAARVEADSGQRVGAYSSEFKLLVDVALIPNRLYGAINLKYGLGTQRARSPAEPNGEESSGTHATTAEESAGTNGVGGDKGFDSKRAKWVESAFTTVSAALAYQVMERVLVGIEARYLTEFSGAFLNEFSGHAVFVGPNLFLRISDYAALSFAWTPQLGGRGKGVPASLDLNNFERHQFRLKFSASF